MLPLDATGQDQAFILFRAKPNGIIKIRFDGGLSENKKPTAVVFNSDGSLNNCWMIKLSPLANYVELIRIQGGEITHDQTYSTGSAANVSGKLSAYIRGDKIACQLNHVQLFDVELTGRNMAANPFVGAIAFADEEGSSIVEDIVFIPSSS